MRQRQLMFWSAHARELTGSTDGKVKAILAQGCLQYIPADGEHSSHYLCHPIKNPDGSPYNKTTYLLKPSDKECGGHTSCTCFGFRQQEKKWHADPDAPRPSCSHAAALHELFSRKHKLRQGIQSTFGVASAIVGD